MEAKPAETAVNEMASPDPGRAALPALPDATILVADDDPIIRELLERMLAHAGCRVLTAADGQTALDLFREKQQEIDLVLMDIIMPRLDGEAAFAAMRGIDPGVEVVFISGHGDVDQANRLLKDGALDYLKKPFEVDELFATIQAALHRPQVEG